MTTRILGKGAIAICAALLVAGCNGDSPTAPGGGGGGGGGNTAVASVTVSGTLTVSEGATSQLQAMARRGNGTTEDVTARAIWRSANSTFATVSSTGLVTGRATGTVEITAEFSGVTGRNNVAVAAASWRLRLNISRVTALGTCDLIGAGEFAVRVRATPTGGSAVTIVETDDYPGNASDPRGYTLSKDESENFNRDRTFTLAGIVGNRLRVEISATEWDEEIVVFPPSTRWDRDSDMNNRTAGRNHTFTSGAFTGLGNSTLDVGTKTSCRLRLTYSLSATKIN